MNKNHLAMSALLAALLSAAGASSLAQDRYHGERDDSRYSQRDQDRGDRRGDDRRGDDRRMDDRRRDGYDARGGRHYGDEGAGGRRDEGRRWDGAGPNHDIRRGGRLPARYRNHQYVVNDWRSHHLRPPPRGYHWVQTGGDYVLAAIATGIIAELIINQ